jgi:orotidine-5'-phosphate decarboxylase
MRFGARLRAAVERDGPLCVGIDPHPSLLAAWGLPDSVAGLSAFGEIVLDALVGVVPVLKPQSAFYERFGSPGIAVLESVIRQSRSDNVLVILDVKRGDIGSTAAAYADAYLDRDSALCADAITASPYLGFGALRPMVDKALANQLGLFVLALTSNPEGAAVQRARGADSRTVAQHLIDEIAQVNDGVQPMGDIGVVVGVTVAEADHDLVHLNGPILAPGLGAQGGRPEDLVAVFGDSVHRVLPTSSREVLAAGPTRAALRDAAARARDACAAALAITP